MALGLVSLGQESGRLQEGEQLEAQGDELRTAKEKEQELCEEIEALTLQADRCDEEEDRVYQERTGYELPDDLRDKKQRLKKVREMKQRWKRGRRSFDRVRRSRTRSSSALRTPRRGS